MSPPRPEPGPPAREKPGLDADALFDGEVFVVLPDAEELDLDAEPGTAGAAAASPAGQHRQPAAPVRRPAARTAPAPPAPTAHPARPGHPARPPAPRPAPAPPRPAPVARRVRAGQPPSGPGAPAGEDPREAARQEAAAASTLRWCRAAGLLGGGLLAVLLAAGWRYYLTPPALRPFHFQHAALRPSGPVGLTLGIAGTAVILATLGYVLRKRLVSWGRAGSLRGWMTWHVLAGVGGPVMILFHSSFAPSSAIGLLAFCAMWVAVASGFVGRYIHVHLPKAADGRELGFEDLRHRLAQYRRKLVALGVDGALLPAEAPHGRRREWLWLIHALAAVLWGDRAARRELEALRGALLESMDDGPERQQALRLARRLCEGRQSLARHREIRRLMAAWRFFHGWFVVILLAGILFHVAIAVKYGGLWILGGRP